MDCTAMRQDKILSSYYFKCECDRCTDTTIEKNMYTLRCQVRIVVLMCTS